MRAMRKAAECVVGFAGAAAPNKGPPPLKLRRVNLRKMHKEYLEDKSNQRRARSPDDSAGEHNKGSGWTAACRSE